MSNEAMPDDPPCPPEGGFRTEIEPSRPQRNGVGAFEAVESRSGAVPLPEGVDRERRIARRLHDEVQQLLFGIRLKCTIARSRTSNEAHALSADLSDIESWAAEAITTVQELHAELSETVRPEEKQRAR